MSNTKLIINTNLKTWKQHNAHITSNKTYAIKNTQASKLQNEDIKKSEIKYEHRRKLIYAGILAITQFPSKSQSQENLETDKNRIYFDISVDNKPYGKITIELFPDVKLGSQRFLDLAIGKSGVGYRLSKFDALTKAYIRNEGVKSLTYDETAVSPISGGESLKELISELYEQKRTHDEAGLVSLVVQDDKEIKKKSRLVTIKGKFVFVEEEIGGTRPNGTAFCITTGSVQELDSTNLIVGRVIDGLDLVKGLQELPTIKDNTGSIFFKVAKQFGDKRADVAEKGFGKPFNKISITRSGKIEKV